MKVSPVSFGQVIAVSGKPKKIQQLRDEIGNTANIARVDFTNYYKNTYSNGLIGMAARNNHAIDLYITGDDYSNFTKKRTGWQTMNEVSCQLDKYYDLTKTSVSAVKTIIKESR